LRSRSTWTWSQRHAPTVTSCSWRRRATENINLYKAENEAVTLGATEISDSWGGPEEPGETSDDSYFHHPGVPITVAAGDNGYEVEYPAASQYVIAVGGTSPQAGGELARVD